MTRQATLHWTLNTALLISFVLGCNFDAGAEWLHQRRRRGTLLEEGPTRAQTRSMLADVSLRANVEAFALWQDPSHCSLSGSIRKTADGSVRGYQIAQWVRQRSELGSAAPAASLIERFRESAEDVTQHFVRAEPVAMSWLSRGPMGFALEAEMRSTPYGPSG